jgi:hypothetical protein
MPPIGEESPVDVKTAKASILEQLYNLDRDALRAIIWEALLICDGPDKIDGETSSTIDVTFVVNARSGRKAFAVASEEF